MRKIKFRAWLMCRKKMIYCDLHDRNWYFHPKEPHLYREKHQRDHTLPVMQYTGLIDKNGIEIYEGDIVLHSHRMCIKRFKGNIIYHNKFYSFGINMKPIYYDKADLFLFFYDIDISSVEVIGNIYESQQLL